MMMKGGVSWFGDDLEITLLWGRGGVYSAISNLKFSLLGFLAAKFTLVGGWRVGEGEEEAGSTYIKMGISYVCTLCSWQFLIFLDED